MGDLPRRRRRLRSSAAVAAVIGVTAAGCSSGADTQALPASTAAVTALAIDPSTTAPIPTAATAPVAVDTPTKAADTTVAPVAAAAATVDGAALLHGAVGAMAAGYHFATTLTIGGAVVLTAVGDRVGDGTRLGVTQGDVSVQYVITPAGTWVQPEGGDWQQLDTPTASTDPILALASPSTVTVASVTGTATTVTAAVTPAALGLAGDAPVNLSATIDNGAITTVGYVADVNGKPATMQAVISPVVDASPVVAPA